MNDRFVTMREVLDRVALSKAEVYRRIRSGTFPKPIQIGKRRIAFLESEVQAWMDSRIKSSEQ